METQEKLFMVNVVMRVLVILFLFTYFQLC